MVKRYYQWCVTSHGHALNEHESGDLIKASDYDALIAKLEAMNKKWRENMEKAKKPISVLTYLKCSDDIQRIIDEMK